MNILQEVCRGQTLRSDRGIMQILICVWVGCNFGQLLRAERGKVPPIELLHTIRNVNIYIRHEIIIII